MQVYRLSRAKYAHTLSGKGAAIRGARWNSPGTEIIYTAENRSLAMAEVAVHLTIATIPGDYVMLTIFVPDDATIYEVNEAELPENWNQFPHGTFTQSIGDFFVEEQQNLTLRVPSVVTPGDFNILINPHHSSFDEVKILQTEKFHFDRRLFTKEPQ